MYPDTLTEMDRFLASGGFQSIKFSSVVFSSIYLAETIQICCLSAACHMALVENNKANQMKKFVVNTSKGSFHPRHIEKDYPLAFPTQNLMYLELFLEEEVREK